MSAESEITAEQWEKAKQHFDSVFEQYHDLLDRPGVNAILAMEFTFLPLFQRYNSGERSQELYQEMLEVE